MEETQNIPYIVHVQIFFLNFDTIGLVLKLLNMFFFVTIFKYLRYFYFISIFIFRYLFILITIADISCSKVFNVITVWAMKASSTVIKICLRGFRFSK